MRSKKKWVSMLLAASLLASCMMPGQVYAESAIPETSVPEETTVAETTAATEEVVEETTAVDPTSIVNHTTPFPDMTWEEWTGFHSDGLAETSNVIGANSNFSFSTKKGLQGAILRGDDMGYYQDLGVKHTLFNVYVDALLDPKNNGMFYQEFTHTDGKTYTFGYITELTDQEAIQSMLDDGWTISIVLLCCKDSKYAKVNGSAPYSAWNTEQYGAELDALCNYLAYTYSGANGQQKIVTNWIIGNEVNMPNHYNNTGSLDVTANAQAEVNQLSMLQKYLDIWKTSAKTYVSIDHSWCHNDEGRGIAARDYLDCFNQLMNSQHPGMSWNIALHLYTPIMTDSRVWVTDYQNKSASTPFVSAYNLNYITDYIKNTYGSEHQVLLSEQGFTVANGQESTAAASLAYTYYAGEFNDMVNGIIFRTLRDDAAEAAQGFNFGLMSSMNRGDPGKREGYNVFKYMDTAEYLTYTKKYHSMIGINSWNDVVSNFYQGKFFDNSAMEQQTNAFIGNAYRVFLGREPDEGGRVYWLNGLMSGELDGASFLCGIFFSDEFKALNYDNDTFVKKMYKGMFNRDWDASGYNDWMSQLEAGADRFVVIRGFVMSDEYFKMCDAYDIAPGNFDSIRQYGGNSSDATEETTGTTEAPTEAVEGENTASGLRKVYEPYGTAHVSISEPSRSVDPTSKEYALTSEFVKRFYTKGLKRTYDQAGLEDWTGGLQNGKYTAANIAVGFFHSPEFLGFETTDEDFVERLYQVYLGRDSDPSGKADFLNQLSMGYSRDFIMYRFIYSPEFLGLCETYGIDLGEYYVY